MEILTAWRGVFLRVEGRPDSSAGLWRSEGGRGNLTVEGGCKRYQLVGVPEGDLPASRVAEDWDLQPGVFFGRSCPRMPPGGGSPLSCSCWGL